MLRRIALAALLALAPAFAGAQQAIIAPTAPASANNNQIANTAWVNALTALYAPLNSPAFTGIPTAPTAPILQNSTQIATTAYVDRTTREKLSAARTYFVRPLGSDTNCSGLVDVNDPGSGATPRACAYSTPQKATDVTLYNLDLNGKTVTLNLTGAFTSGISCAGTFVGAGSTTVVGAGTVYIATPSTASITTNSANAITASEGCNLTVGSGITLSTTGASGVALMAYNNGSIIFGAVTFGPAIDGHIQAGYVNTPTGNLTGPGTIYAVGDYTITGGSVFHWHVPTAGSVISAPNRVITLSGTPAFSGFFAGITKGMIFGLGTSFAGTGATGAKYLIHNGGTLLGLAGSALPGSTTVPLASGGIINSNATGVDAADSSIGISNIVGGQVVAPASPAAGVTASWFDSTDLRFHDKNPAGAIGTTVVADTGASNNFLTAISAAGVITKAQPSYANISGTHNTNTNFSLSAGQATALAGGATNYAGLAAICGGSEPACYVPASAPATLKNFYATTPTAPGGAQTFTFTIRSGAYGALSDSGVTCTITGSATTCNDTTHTLAVTAGQVVTVKMVASATAASSSGIAFTMTAVTTSP